MAFHKNLTGSDVHVPYAFSYANSTARAAATGFTSLDVGKFARQVDSNTIWMLTNHSPISWAQIGAAAGGISDGDKGDITVSSSGAAWTIDAEAVTYAKIQNVSGADKLLGRTTAGAGSIEEVTCTAAGRALLDDADASAQRTTLGLGTLATQSGTFSGSSSGTNTGDQSLFSTIAVAGQSNVVADSASDTLTLVAGSNVTITTDASTDTITISATGGGGGGVSDGDKGDITVSGSGATWTIDSQAVTYAKIQNVATNRLLGRASSGAGVAEELTLGSNLSFSGTQLDTIGLQKTITSGTAAPSGGSDGDIYLQYV